MVCNESNETRMLYSNRGKKKGKKEERTKDEEQKDNVEQDNTSLLRKRNKELVVMQEDNKEGEKLIALYEVDPIWMKLMYSKSAERRSYNDSYFLWEERRPVNTGCNEFKKVFWFLSQVGKKKERIMRELFSIELVKEADRTVMKGLAIARFEKGDIITCLSNEEVFDGAKGTFENEGLYFGGTLFKAEGSEWERNRNACVTSCGIIRATQRILPGEEIYVDHKPSMFYPVLYLDARIVREDHSRGALMGTDNGVIIHIGSGEGRKETYTVKYKQDGKVERLTRRQVEKRMIMVYKRPLATRSHKRKPDVLENAGSV